MPQETCKFHVQGWQNVPADAQFLEFPYLNCQVAVVIPDNTGSPWISYYGIPGLYGLYKCNAGCHRTISRVEAMKRLREYAKEYPKAL